MKWGLLYFRGTTLALTHRYSAAADQTRGKGKTKPKQNRKKIITCFPQTCICKHQAFYLLGQMAQAHWSHTLFYLRTENDPWLLPCHLLFQSGTKLFPAVTAPLSECFTVCGEEKSAPEREKPGGSAPQLCPGTGAAPQPVSSELFCRRSSGSSPFQAVQLSDTAVFIQPSLADCAAEGYLTSTICSLLTKHSQANNPVPI